MVQHVFFTTTYSLIYFISIAVFCWLVIWSRKIRNNPAIFPFQALMVLFIIWALDYSCFSFTQKLEEWIFLEQIAYLPYAIVPVFCFILAWQYTDHKDFFKNRWVIIPFIIPAITLFFTWVPQFQHLLMYDFFINTQGLMATLDYKYGFWAYIHLINGAIFEVGSLIILANTVYFHPKRHQKGNTCLIIGIFVLVFWNLIYLTGFIPPWVFNLPVPFLLIGFFFAFAIFRYHFLDFLPMARNYVLEQINEPFIILASDGLILDMNPSLARVFILEPKESIGIDFKRVFSKWPELISIITNTDWESKKDQVFSLERGEGKESYLIKRSLISDADSEIRGTVLTFHDISELESTRILLAESNEELKSINVQLHDEISERIKFETALKRSESTLRTILDSMHDAVFVHDEDGTILEVNAQMLKIYHIPDKSVITQFPNVKDYSHPDSPVDMLQSYWNSVFSGDDVLFEGRSICPLDKETFDAEFFLTRIEFENRPAILASVRNISERKQAERALFNANEELKVRTEEVQNQSRFLQDLMDTLPIPIFYKDINGIYTGCNTEFERYYGQSRDHIIGKSVYELWPGPMAEVFFQADLQVFQTPHRQQYETTIRYHDGSVHDVIFYKAPIFTISNHVDGLIGTFLDITERKRAEEALKESESFNRGLIENLPDYIAVYGYDKKILYVNPALTTALGYSFDDLVSQPVFSYIADEFRSQSEEIVSTRLQGDIAPIYEADILCRDKTRRSVIIKGTQIQYRQNPAILLLMSDITVRKEMEQALKENEEKFVSIFEKTPDPVLILNSSYQIVEVNRGFEKYFDYSQIEVHGKNVDDLGIRLQQDAIKDLFTKSGSDFHAFHIEMELVNRTGAPFIAEVTISRIIINNESCFIIQIHDIDEIRKAHEAISQVNHKLKILSSITRHDILNRSMVTSVYSDMLLEDIKDPDFQRKLLAIRQSSDEIRNLIEFTGQYQNLGETIPTWQVLEDLFKFRSIQGLLSGINLILDLKGIEIYADNMLEKVIYNLVENSVRHGKNLTHISLSGHDESGKMVIWYEDDGGGIIPEEKEKAFEKGFGKNTGLGLFLIREILSITGITITENGIFGTGVRFEMVVPAGKWRKRSVKSE